jgi:hypothetical protein
LASIPDRLLDGSFTEGLGHLDSYNTDTRVAAARSDSPGVNATIANPSLTMVTGAGANSAPRSWLIAADWCTHAGRILGWGLAGLISAFASYVFAVAALVLGILGYLRLDGEWWPVALCLFLAYLSARVGVVCMDLALGSGPIRQAECSVQSPTAHA